MTGTPLFPMTSRGTSKVKKADETVWLTPREFMNRLSPKPGYSTVMRWIEKGEVLAVNSSLLSVRYKVPETEVQRIQARLNALSPAALDKISNGM